MKKILCFGDSNTYGYTPISGERLASDKCWCGILQTLFAQNAQIIEAGCNNRTAFKDNPAGSAYTGYRALPTYITTDLDTIILFIGINDLQAQYTTTLNEYYGGLTALIKTANEKCPNAQILLLAPPRINEGILNGFFSTLFDKSAIEKSTKLPEIYKHVAQAQNCDFIDLDKVVSTSEKDGLHLELAAHKTIAETIYKHYNHIAKKQNFI